MWPFSNGKKGDKSNYSESELSALGLAFWEMQCNFGHTAIIPRKTAIAALVVMSTRDRKTGIQEAKLRVASADGGFQVIARTPTKSGEDLRPNDIVMWLPMTQVSLMEMLSDSNDERSSWMGLIMAKIDPKESLGGVNFKVICEYH